MVIVAAAGGALAAVALAALHFVIGFVLTTAVSAAVRTAIDHLKVPQTPNATPANNGLGALWQWGRDWWVNFTGPFLLIPELLRVLWIALLCVLFVVQIAILCGLSAVWAALSRLWAWTRSVISRPYHWVVRVWNGLTANAPVSTAAVSSPPPTGPGVRCPMQPVSAC